MPKFKLMSRHWIVDENDRIIMGEGRMQILENIEKTGSLNQTAKVMKMSYRAVWGKMEATEKCLKKKIVDRDKKEGTRITQEGRELLEKYRHFKKLCRIEEERIFQSVFPRKE